MVELWDAMNRIIHARKLDVGWETVPSEVAVIAGGAIVVPYVQAETDRREYTFIDPFAMAHAFLYKALALLEFGRTTASTTIVTSTFNNRELHESLCVAMTDN